MTPFNTLYVEVFLIQVVALPIMVFWGLIKFANSLFDINVPVMLHHSRVSKNEIVSTINPADG